MIVLIKIKMMIYIRYKRVNNRQGCHKPISAITRTITTTVTSTITYKHGYIINYTTTDSGFIRNSKWIEISRSNCKISKLSELAVKLARESFFGEKVMSESTVYGARGYKKLPPLKVQNLKNTIFLLCPHYAYQPHLFEPIWNHCCDAIIHASSRLQKKYMNSAHYFSINHIESPQVYHKINFNHYIFFTTRKLIIIFIYQ